MAKTWEYNGVSLEFDAEDIETLERYENAFAEMQSLPYILGFLPTLTAVEFYQFFYPKSAF